MLTMFYESMKKIDYCGLVILSLSPIIVNIILGIPAICTINGDTNGWLGFYGSFVGAIIPMFILYRTRQWNKEDNNETKEVQHKILQYQAKKIWFEEFKKQLDENYRLLDFQSITIVVNNIVFENYQIALPHLMQLNRNIEMQGYSFDLHLGNGGTEKEYIDSYNELLKEYGMLVNDLIVICNIGNIIKMEGDYKEYVINIYKLQKDCLSKNEIVKVSPFLEKISKIICDETSIDEIISTCQKRMFDTFNVHARKEELIVATKTLLRSKEQEIENILL